MTRALLPATAQAYLEPKLPDWLEPVWWDDSASMLAAAPQAEIAWLDMHDKSGPLEAIRLAKGLRWLSSNFAGVDWLPLAELEARGITLTNGAGLAANQVAEFAVMAMLNVARGYREIVRAQDRGEWLPGPPARRELAGSQALVIGYGAIGQAVGRMLGGFGAHVTPVTRSGSPGTLKPHEWQARLGEFDWVILTAPGTAETAHMFGTSELAAMKREGVLVNIARASMIDQPALVQTLREGRIHAAILDLTDPEPLPPGHELWLLENAHITMHLAGIPTPATLTRGLDRFLANCERFHTGKPLEATVDLALGY